ncbi:MAG: YceI family protein [Saprospiraceae bacterium]|nr:YceI family protein [Saprospiraceae bacterium]MDZ4706316.1 YceI family protein [Saprospiraceae bacterium]
MKVNLTLILFLAIGQLFGQTAFSVSAYKMTIKGTSNLHDWESTVKELRAKGDFSLQQDKFTALNALSVEVPVKSIKSTKGSIMDNKTYDALKADSHPNINFKLEGVTPIKAQTDGYTVTASGNLTFAGSTKKVELTAKGKSNGDGTITFSGSQKIKMTDFGIKPPTALMGTMKVGNEVEVVFSVTMKKS